MNRDIELLAPFRNFWFLGRGPLVQVFDGIDARIDDWEKLGVYDFELWLVEIGLKRLTKLFGVLLYEERKLAKLLPTIFERDSYPIVAGGSKSRVDLGLWDTGPL